MAYDGSEFAFKPGDIVTVKVDVHRTEPPRWMLIERITQECAGGVQRKYVLRSFGWNAEGTLFRQAQMEVIDIEVCAYPSAAELAERQIKNWADMFDAKQQAKKRSEEQAKT